MVFDPTDMQQCQVSGSRGIETRLRELRRQLLTLQQTERSLLYDGGLQQASSSSAHVAQLRQCRQSTLDEMGRLSAERVRLDTAN